MAAKVTNIPKTIYLNIGEIPDGETVNFNDLCEVTWSAERVNDDDIEYTIKR